MRKCLLQFFGKKDPTQIDQIEDQKTKSQGLPKPIDNYHNQIKIDKDLKNSINSNRDTKISGTSPNEDDTLYRKPYTKCDNKPQKQDSLEKKSNDEETKQKPRTIKQPSDKYIKDNLKKDEDDDENEKQTEECCFNNKKKFQINPPIKKNKKKIDRNSGEEKTIETRATNKPKINKF